MPNWCHNTLKVSGPQSSVHAFQSAVAGPEGGLSFGKVYPTPEEKMQDEGWHRWRVENWGTKWDLGETECPALAPVFDDGEKMSSCVYSFETAWSPPVPWSVFVSGAFPELEFELEFAETGCDFAGRVVAASGQIVEDVELSVEEVLPREEDRWF